MADKKEASNNPEVGGDLRSTLAKRLAVAGVLVAVLLGVLAFFDYLASPEEPEPVVFTRPVPVAPKKEVTQPVTPAESLPEPPKTEAAPEKPAEPPPKPEVPPQPAVPVPPPAPDTRPEVKQSAKPAASAVPALPSMAKPVPPIQPPQTQLGKPAAPAAPAIPPPPQLARPVVPAAPAPTPESTAAPVVRLPEAAKPAQPVSRPPEAVPAARPPALPRLLKGFVVQAGVFTSVQHAEELHAKLTLNGIPSTLEARVQAGPFKTREEAAAAREKMKALGIDAVLLPPKGGR